MVCNKNTHYFPRKRQIGHTSFNRCGLFDAYEEAAYIRDYEEKIELVLQNRLSPGVLELSETYFSSNPVAAYSVPRNFHWQNYNQSYDQDYDPGYAQSEVVYCCRNTRACYIFHMKNT